MNPTWSCIYIYHIDGYIYVTLMMMIIINNDDDDEPCMYSLYCHICVCFCVFSFLLVF